MLALQRDALAARLRAGGRSRRSRARSPACSSRWPRSPGRSRPTARRAGAPRRRPRRRRRAASPARRGDRVRGARARRDPRAAVPRGRQRAVRRLGVLARARRDRARRAARCRPRERDAAHRRGALRARPARRVRPRRRRSAATRPASGRSSPGPSSPAPCSRPAAPTAARCSSRSPCRCAYWQLYPAIARRRARQRRPVDRRAPTTPRSCASSSARPGSFRVEIPFTENHWEAAHVAPHVPLARGWERQLDRRYGALFYDGTLTPRRYRAWLDEHAVAYVALPDVPLDYAAPRRGAAHRARACRTCARSGAARTGASTRSRDPRRSPTAPRARRRCSPTASRSAPRARGDVLVRVRHTPLVGGDARARLRARAPRRHDARRRAGAGRPSACRRASAARPAGR